MDRRATVTGLGPGFAHVAYAGREFTVRECPRGVVTWLVHELVGGERAERWYLGSVERGAHGGLTVSGDDPVASLVLVYELWRAYMDAREAAA